MKQEQKRGLRKRRSRKTCRNKELEKVTEPDSRFSEISERLRGVEPARQQLSQGLNGVQKCSDTALGRARNVVFRGNPEPFTKGGEQRKWAVINQVKRCSESWRQQSPGKMAGGQRLEMTGLTASASEVR